MWNELSVDLNHRSHFADLVLDREGSESPAEFMERYEDDWDGIVDEEGDFADHDEDNQSSDELLDLLTEEYGDE